MKFFEAQKRAAFAGKLFTAAGFDFDAALAAGDVSALSAFLDARATGVSALFATAGLDLPALLASGPDSLKAHLDGLTVKAEEFSALTTQLAETGEKLKASEGQVAGLGEMVAHVTTALALPLAADTKPEQLKTAFESYVAKQTTLALAKSGHPPVADLPADATSATPSASDADLRKKWKAMAPGEERDAFFSANQDAIWRATQAASSASAGT